jgi:hypothetical protein
MNSRTKTFRSKVQTAFISVEISRLKSIALILNTHSVE